jgi:hypothetical protein
LLSNTTALCDDVTLTQLTLRVTNKLPVPVAVDGVSVDLESQQFGIITYTSGPATLPPGEETVTVSCSVS